MYSVEQQNKLEVAEISWSNQLPCTRRAARDQLHQIQLVVGLIDSHGTFDRQGGQLRKQHLIEKKMPDNQDRTGRVHQSDGPQRLPGAKSQRKRRFPSVQVVTRYRHPRSEVRLVIGQQTLEPTLMSLPQTRQHANGMPISSNGRGGDTPRQRTGIDRVETNTAQTDPQGFSLGESAGIQRLIDLTQNPAFGVGRRFPVPGEIETQGS